VLAITVVERNSSPLTAHPAGTIIGAISLNLPVLTLIITGAPAVKLSSTYSVANRIVLKGFWRFAWSFLWYSLGMYRFILQYFWIPSFFRCSYE
jgi:hypothetical protein